jgi:NitT/TauT family transport system substrate-binding protein
MRLVRVRATAKASRIVLVSASAAVLAAGCLGTGGSGPGGSGGGSVTVGIVPGVDNASLQVGVEDGLFRQQGLNVEIQTFNSIAAEMQALASGRVNIAGGDYTDFFYEQSQFAQGHPGDVPLRLIADGYDAAANSVAVLTLPTSGITTPQQLQGQRVATPPAQVAPYLGAVPYNIQTLVTEQVLQNDGVSPSSVLWKQMPMPNMITALRNGTVKAILVSEPYIFEAEAQLGAVVAVDASSGVTASLPLSGYFSQASYATAHASTVQAFQTAMRQVQAHSAMRGPVQAVLPHLTGMTTQSAAMVTLGTYPTFLSVGQIQRVATLMYDSGMITNTVTVSALAAG